jgi:hypothetical protein
LTILLLNIASAEAYLPLYTDDSIETRKQILEEKKLVLSQQKKLIEDKKKKAEDDLQYLGTLEQERIREHQISLVGGISKLTN